MSRGLLSGFGKSGKKKKKSAREMFEAKRRGEDDESLTPEQRYQKLVQEKTDELRKQMQKGSKGGFVMPGTDPEAGKKLSKSAEALIEMMAQKQAKAAQKKMVKASAIQAKWLGASGRIDKSGKIYGADGKCVGSIDAKSGKIKASSGRTIGKYEPGSPMNETMIVRFIQSQAKKPAAPGSHGTISPGGFWGGGGDDNKGGGFW